MITIKRKRLTIFFLMVIVLISSIYLGMSFGKYKLQKKMKVAADNKVKNIDDKEDKEKQKEQKKIVETKPWTGSIEHIFFHPLISNPEEAFKGDWRTNNFDDWFVTVGEFNKIIKSLYNKNYVLVDINDVYEEYEQNGLKRMRRKKLNVPQGKKPLIISVDDLCYNDGMRGGTCDKLILDSDGNIATFTKKKNGEEKISKDNEIISIMEKFIKEHPDFSLNGARGTIALTGYQGILGYATNFEAYNHEKERVEAQKVVNKLKKIGWTFASHSYGHNDTRKISLEKFKKDADKWEREVASLVGSTQIFVYPHGWSSNHKEPKFKYLQSKGFKIFYSVGKEPYEKILKDTCVVIGDRMAVDGMGLRTKRERFMRFYDSKDIIDLKVRPNRKVEFD